MHNVFRPYRGTRLELIRVSGALLLSLLSGAGALACGSLQDAGPPAGVAIRSFAPSTATLSSLTQESEVVELHLALDRQGAAPEAVIRLGASLPAGCSGSWIPWRADSLPSSDRLEARVELPAPGPAQVTRRFAFDCGRPGRFQVRFTAQVISPPGRRAPAMLEVEASPHYVEDELLVVFRSGLGRREAARKAGALGTRVLEVIPAPEVEEALPGARRIYWLKIVSGRSVPETIDRFLADPDVEIAEPDYIGGIDGHEHLPNDLASGQWGLLNVGQPVAAGGPGIIDADVDAPRGWDLTTDCRSVVVAVADTGVLTGHPELTNNLVPGVDLIDGDADPNPDLNDPFRSHGTAVAGVIGAQGDNTAGLTGICWRAAILPIRMMPYQVRPGLVRGWTLDRFVRMAFVAILSKVVGGRNVKAINLSGSMLWPGDTPQMVIGWLDRADILLVTSAGNEPYDVDDDEDIYRDVDGSGTVSAGDVRLTRVSTLGGVLAAGTVVAPGDGDLRLRLVPFAADELHADPGANGAYDPGEAIYRDAPPAPRTRLTPVGALLPGSFVTFGDPDAGTRVIAFAADERHTETGIRSGLPSERAFFNGRYNYGARYPCSYTEPNVLCVGSSDKSDALDFDGDGIPNHNFGRTSVDLVAPGRDVLLLGVDVDRGPPRRLVAGALHTSTGTSFATPHVTGIAALCWSLRHLADRTDTEMKALLLRFVDRKPNMTSYVASGGRLTWACSSDLGDAPNSYQTTSAEPQLDCDTPGVDGPIHLDYGNEWLGREVSGEHNANTPPPRDQDPGGPNVAVAGAPACPGGVRVDGDDSDDAGFTYTPPPPWAAGQVVGVEFQVCSHLIDNPVAGVQVRDAAGGRYQVADPDKRVYADFFLDINRNGVFDLPAERPALVGRGGHVIDELELPPAAGGAAPLFPPPTGCRTVSRSFTVPPPGGTPSWTRWRLDYGEHAGANDPAPLFLRDLRPPAAPVPSPLRIVRHGEVEDDTFPPPPPSTPYPREEGPVVEPPETPPDRPPTP